jgi:putative DNA primase/helicase
MDDLGEAPIPDPFARLSPDESAEAKTDRRTDDWVPQVPAPPGAVLPAHRYLPGKGYSNGRYVYLTETGEIVTAVYRWDFVDAEGKPDKITLPLTYGTLDGEEKWHCKAPPVPSGLYRLPQLVAEMTKPVLVVEGEKTADAAVGLFPDMAVVTWRGGSNAVTKADWARLSNRSVVIWPDNDEPGQKAADHVAQMLHEIGAAEVRIVEVPVKWPNGWDLADELPGDVTLNELRLLVAKARVETQPTKMPDGYSIDGKGVWYHPPSSPPKVGRNSEPEPVFISGPFEVVAETKDDASGSWGMLLRWRDRDKQEHQWAMPRKLLHSEGNAIASALEDAGLSVATGRSEHELLKSLLSRMATTRRMLCVSRSGWHQADPGLVYMLPNGKAIGPGSSGVILQSEKAIVSGGQMQSRGTLEDWQENIGRLAVNNDRVALFIAAALAAPLLHLVTEANGGIHLYGKSRDGKTTTLAAASSVWGKGDSSGQIRSWRATGNGLEGIASETCDGLLALDEIGQANAQEVGDIVYMLSNGAGKNRAARDGSARAQRTWRTLFLSTGEIPLAAKMAEKGNKPRTGQDIRLVSLPADAGGKFGVFQELHGYESPVAFANHLRAATSTYYGVAAPAFLAKLTQALATDEEGLRAFLVEHRSEFCQANVPKDADGQVQSVAGRFALIAAAGEFGVQFGVLPWPKGEATRAAAASFMAWLNARGNAGSGEDTAALAQVRQFIETHGESRFTAIGLGGEPQNSWPPGESPEASENRITFNRVGFRRKDSNGNWEYLILPEAWKGEVCKGVDYKGAAVALLEAGFLIRGDSQHLTCKVQVTGYDRMRFYVIKGSILGGPDE